MGRRHQHPKVLGCSRAGLPGLSSAAFPQLTEEKEEKSKMCCLGALGGSCSHGPAAAVKAAK